MSDLNVRALSYEERGIYVELLSLCWLEHGLPNDPEKLAAVLALCATKFATAWAKIASLFYLDGELWQHKRLDDERAKQRKYHRAMQLNGKQGGRPSKSRGLAADKPPVSRSKAEKSFAIATATAIAEESTSAREKVWKFSSLYVSQPMHRIVLGVVGKRGEGIAWDAFYERAACDYAERGQPSDVLADLKLRARKAVEQQRDERPAGYMSAEETKRYLERLGRTDEMTPDERKAAAAQLRSMMTGARV